MEPLKHKLFQLILGKEVVCCLCLQNVEEDSCSILDIMTLDYYRNIIEIGIISILEYVLGSECVENLTTQVLCRDCLMMSLKCYKFINSCKEKAKYFSNSIGSILKLCDDTNEVAFNYRTMYVSINEDTFTGTQYYDQRSVGNSRKALKRLEIISNPSHLDATEHIFDTYEYIDNSELTKQRKTKRSHPEDLIDKISIDEILCDKNESSMFKCKACKREFSKLHNLKRHFVRLHAPKDYVCSKCNKSFGSPAILEEHRLGSHSGKKAICVECGKKYANSKSLKLHELSHKLILKCEACGKIFNRQRNYQIHVTSKRCEQIDKRRQVEKKYICDYCNKRYACKGTLRVHIQFEHGNGCHHICSWCGKKFCSLGKLKAHTVTHTREKKFSCEICGGCYVTKESLLYHTRTHTGEKPYQCAHCDQRFLSTSRRAEHIRRHHMDPLIECDVCHTKFKVRSCLLKHKKRHFDPNSRLHYTKLVEN